MHTTTLARIHTDATHKGKLIHDIKNSASYKAGRAITWPARVLYDAFSGSAENTISTKAGLLLSSLFYAFRRPVQFFRHINGKNISILFYALKNEPPSQIYGNFKALINSSASKGVVVPSNHITESKAIPAKTEVSSKNAVTILHCDIAKQKDEHLSITGWIVSNQKITKIEIYDSASSTLVGSTQNNIPRPDVTKEYAHLKYYENPGFKYKERVESAISSVTIRAFENNYLIIEEVFPIQQNIEFSPNIKDVYQAWIQNNTITDGLRQKLIAVQRNFSYQPLISIVMPVYNVEKVWLEKAIESIENQIYENWELCIADDASTLDYIQPYLEAKAAENSKIKVVFRENNGHIAQATNSALDVAEGEYVVFMDNDDELASHALFEIAYALNNDNGIDVLYSDEDKISENGRRYDPWFKPDWSPELLLSYNYFNHLTCIRKSIVLDCGKLRSDYDGCQDYDLVLRAVRKAKKIHHISKVLYHWRALETSIAGSGAAKNDQLPFFDRCKAAIKEHISALGHHAAKVVHPEMAQSRNAGFFTLRWPDQGPLVSIVIPTKNHYKTLKKCLDSLQKTTYANYEIIIVDNGSDDINTLKYLNAIKGQESCRVITIPNKGLHFSFAYINNEAVKHANGELILLLNDDTEVITPHWLSQMVGYHSIEGVEITGAKLLYPDKTIQHAGVINGVYPQGYDNLPEHAFKNLPVDASGYGFYPYVARNYSAVTAACLLINKQYFQEIGGFDEKHFGLAYNDVDLCLRVHQAGGRIVYVPDAVLIHYESKSRKGILHIEEVTHFKNKWRNYKEPYYNINLSKTDIFQIKPFNTFQYDFLENVRRPKILFASHNLNLEGAPIQLYEICEELNKKRGFDIEVCAPVDGPLRERFEAIDTPIHIINDPVTTAIRSKTNYQNELEELKAQIQKISPDIVLANTLVSFYIIEACHELSIPTNWLIHESKTPEEFFSYLPSPIYERALYSFNYMYNAIFVAKSTKDLFTKYLPADNQIVVNNGLETSAIVDFCKNVSKEEAKRITDLEGYKYVILNLGTVCERKGQLDFVQAAIQRIQEGNTEDIYVLVGARDHGITGKYLAKIRVAIKESNTEKHFRIINETREVFQYFRAADIFVCSSYNESYPRVILEAMAFRLPVITTPVFGIKEQVLFNHNALPFPEGRIDVLKRRLDELAASNSTVKYFEMNSSKVLQLINSCEEMADKYAQNLKETLYSTYRTNTKHTDKIISVHIPKTGGVTFRNYIGAVFPDNVYFDYPEEELPGGKTYSEMYIIHGHFRVSKYSADFPSAKYISWVRDPSQIPISLYYYYLREPDFDSPLCRMLYYYDLSLEQFIRLKKDWNIISYFFEDKPIKDFVFIGIVEKYDESIQLFNEMFDVNSVVPVVRGNTNTTRASSKYEVSDNLKKYIAATTSEDQKIYDQAVELHYALVNEYLQVPVG